MRETLLREEKMFKKATGIAGLVLFVLAGSLSAQDTVLHSFAGPPAGGRNPYGSLVLGGNVLYGMTETGGAHDRGTIFKINKDGTGFALLHSFANDGTDGFYPRGTLLLKGKTLYGMTVHGGASGMGTIFKIDTNGTGYVILHSFAGGTADGSLPYGDLVAKGPNLYGMTNTGGPNNTGTIFKIGKNGAGYAVLHSFAAGTGDGANPTGSLIFKGSNMYGMTYSGGTADQGTIFTMNANGSGFALVHSFTDAMDGEHPRGSVLIKSSVIYGVTYRGGVHTRGVIFRLKTNGTGYTVLHEFAYNETNGAYCFGSLIMKGMSLYGLTISGGPDLDGTIFRFNLKNSSFEVLHGFSDADTNGFSPYGSLILKNGILYGMTKDGGTAGYGVIFSFSTK